MLIKGIIVWAITIQFIVILIFTTLDFIGIYSIPDSPVKEKLGVILITEIVVIAVAAFRDALGKNNPTSGRNTISTRMMVKVPKPFSQKKIKEIRANLAVIQRNAVEFLNKQIEGGKFSKKKIRVSVFLPEYESKPLRAVLRMEEQMVINVPDQTETDLRFSSTQGIVGACFSSSRTRFTAAKRDEKGNKYWDSVYNLAEKQLACIDPRLEWILAFPILEEKLDYSLGVIVVDCIDVAVDPDLFESLHNHLILDILGISSILGEAKKVTLTLHDGEIHKT